MEMRRQGTYVLVNLCARLKRSMDDWRKLPRSDPSHSLPWESCAVVGNSGSLIGAGHGADIDSHDMVLRINNSPIKGHEADVGARSTISLLNGWKIHWCGERPSCPCWPYGLDTAIATYVWEPYMRQDIARCRAAQPRAFIFVVDKDLEFLANRVVREYTERRIARLSPQERREELALRRKVRLGFSTGLLAVVMSFGLCRRLSLYGFDRDASQHHFFENRTRHEYLDHDFASEVEFYREVAAGNSSLGRVFPLPPTRLIK
uniref:Cmp-n-acetylneuraminate-beta-galactosamide-alpha--sialyltransferase 1-like n=1 Tax=Tetraselmis sp. GSL018 TaxID=582737 RepID=A0A061QNG5_9CHLO|mmetsp:Transcript_37397/g.88883  ORF Transcript_37397/g.88883 Transcript_37397/m.88883 type:complete len:261 (-) Transcript_37397:38-820(-)